MRWSSWLVLIVTAGCAQSDGGSGAAGEGAGPTVVLDAPVDLELGVGEAREVPGTPFRISFDGIREDSRCPTGVTCAWEGNAVAELGATTGEGPADELVLNTTLDPRSALWNGMRITLVSVEPHPREGERIVPEAYAVRVRVAVEEEG